VTGETNENVKRIIEVRWLR